MAERIAGLAMVALGVWLCVAVWRIAHTGERFFAVGPAFGPLSIGVGIGLILYPSPRSMVRKRGGEGSKVRWADLTTPWKMLAGGGAAAGIAYLLVLMLGFV